MGYEAGELVLKIVGSVTVLGGTALGLARFIRKWGRERREAGHEVLRWEIEAFQANIAALKEENERCHEERERERREHTTDCSAYEARIQRRTQEVHDLRNQLHKAEGLLHVVQMELDLERHKHGKGPWTLGEEPE